MYKKYLLLSVLFLGAAPLSLAQAPDAKAFAYSIEVRINLNRLNTGAGKSRLTIMNGTAALGTYTFNPGKNGLCTQEADPQLGGGWICSVKFDASIPAAAGGGMLYFVVQRRRVWGLYTSESCFQDYIKADDGQRVIQNDRGEAAAIILSSGPAFTIRERLRNVIEEKGMELTQTLARSLLARQLGIGAGCFQ